MKSRVLYSVGPAFWLILMSSVWPNPPITAEQFLELPLPEDGTEYELVRGEVVRMPPSSVRSNAVSMRIVARVGPFVEQHELGEYGGSEGGFRLRDAPDTVRAPDVWFISAARLAPTGLPDSFWTGAPDLAVEVLSPTDRIGAIIRRIGEYLEAGTRLAWLIDPTRRVALIFRPDALPETVGVDGVLDGEDVLPGFTMRLAEVLPPSTNP